MSGMTGRGRPTVQTTVASRQGLLPAELLSHGLSHPDRRLLCMFLFLVWSGCDVGGYSMFVFLCVWPGKKTNESH